MDFLANAVEDFFREQIDTIPHLEALLLLWNHRPQPWTASEMGARLFLAPEAAKEILDDLLRNRLIGAVPAPEKSYYYAPEPDRDRLLDAVEKTYRQELIRVTRMIHSRPSAAIREFARAFRIKREHE